MVVALALAAGGAGAPARGRADCAAPLTYGVKVTGSTVQVCPDPYVKAPANTVCPGDGLIRASADAAVLITSCDAQGCFVDECVPPGTYRYGRKTPFACRGTSCGTYYFVTTTLTASADGCQRTSPAPTPYTGALPWPGNDPLICSYQYGGGSGAPDPNGNTNTNANGNSNGNTSSGTPQSGTGGSGAAPTSGGCGTGGPAAVLAIDALVLAAGIALWRSRRGARRA